MKLETKSYEELKCEWPKSGKGILASFDSETIVVYQAYCPSIGNFAAENQYFGGDFKLSRMSWIKPNFMWMMYRCGWAAKEGQEVVLAVRILRTAFDEILEKAVHSTFNSDLYENHDAWKSKVNSSEVRLQWDPDHGPKGEKLDRRAIQLGLRGEAILKYSQDWIVEIEDVSEFVRKQSKHIGVDSDLQIPAESVYPVPKSACAKLEIDWR